MKTVFAKSIWATGMIPIEEWPYRNLKRIMFPVIDLSILLSSLFAVMFGIPAISRVYDRGIIDIFAGLGILAAFVALLGVSFPCLWQIEIIAKSVLIGLLTVYLGSLIFLGIDGDVYRWFSSFIVVVAMCPVIWRITLLGSEWQIRRNPPEEI